MTKWVYSFGDGSAEGRAEMRSLLGGKGANLAEMSNLGLPVPPGFTVTTEVCTAYYDNDRQYPADLKSQIDDALAQVEKTVGAKFGDPGRPLLVSVRSGARASMPGMMDTVLNLGLNAETVKGIARNSGNERFAWDSYRRFIQMYSDVVLGVEHHNFEELLDQMKSEKGVAGDTDLDADDLRRLVEMYAALVERELGKPFPQDVHDQLWGAMGAVFGSWMNQRAVTYRRLNNIPAAWGHGAQRASDGVRQHGRQLGDRCRLHPKSLDRCARVLWRVPRERAGRGCRRRNPHAAAPHARSAGAGRVDLAVDGRADAGCFRPVGGYL